ncbi:MAG: hypothetical protein EA398_12005 [Deltaproteobacteria bacterium]|nr:MAG: hypothetical protein EA398_12005 [Deltaproteobacteria bacterium]
MNPVLARQRIALHELCRRVMTQHRQHPLAIRKKHLDPGNRPERTGMDRLRTRLGAHALQRRVERLSGGASNDPDSWRLLIH